MCDEVTRIASETLNCLLAPFEEATTEHLPLNGRSYHLSSRPKTLPTLTEKLKRMPTHPLENIIDIAGARFDCDMTLSEQTALANMFKEDFLLNGFSKVEIKDMREDPHSGYRAIHLHLFSNAGRAEFQIRTVLQAQWANMYEVAADVFGRDIRYFEFGSEVTSEIEEEISLLHEVSDLVRQAENLSDKISQPFFPVREDNFESNEVFKLLQKIYDILQRQRISLSEKRAKLTSKAEE